MKIFVLIMFAGVFFSTQTSAKDVKCTFDGKEITGSCPDDKTPRCDGATKTIKCVEPSIKEPPIKESSSKEPSSKNDEK